MKKIYILALILVNFISYSQSGFGIKVGLNQNQFDRKIVNNFSSFYERLDTKNLNQTKLNYSAGITIRTLSKDSLNRFSTNIEVEYSTFNTKISQYKETYNPLNYEELEPYKTKLHSINTKILGGIKIVNKLYIEIGTELNYIIGKDSIVYPLNMDNQNFNNPVNNETLVYKNTDLFNRFRMFGVGGLFYGINNSFGLSVRYHKEILFWKKRNTKFANDEFLGLESTSLNSNYISVGFSFYF